MVQTVQSGVHLIFKNWGIGPCGNCGNFMIGRRYWFYNGNMTWNKLMCKVCHGEFVKSVQEFRENIIKLINEKKL